MLELILGCLWLCIMFVFSGYIFQFAKLSQKNFTFLPSALEQLLGYAFSCVACFFSLLLFKNLLYGGLVVFILTACAIFFSRHKNHKFKYNFDWNPSVFIKWLFISALAMVYLPLVLTQGVKYHLPEIYDLPKQLSAIISVAHAQQWPMQNPFFPKANFAYNLLFYAPLGLIYRTTQLTSLLFVCYVFSLLWVTWQILTLLELIIDKLGIPKPFQWIGMLFATFFVGLTSLFVNVNNPVGFWLVQLKQVNMWADDPFVSFIFVPQHLFAVACVFAVWVLSYSSLKIAVRLLLQGLLVTASILSSYILAPLILIFFFFFTIKNGLDCLKQQFKRGFVFLATQVVLVAAVVLPFLVQVKGWAHSNDWPAIYLNTDKSSWLYLILQYGFLFFYAIASFFYIRRSEQKTLWYGFSILIFMPIIFLAMIHYPDANIKTILLLRFTLVPFSVAGVVFLYNKMKDYKVLLYVLVAIPVLFSSLVSLLNKQIYLCP